MYAFYSLLVYIFYTLFRRDGEGAAAAAAHTRDSSQGAGSLPRSSRPRRRRGRRRGGPQQDLWTELNGLDSSSDPDTEADRDEKQEATAEGAAGSSPEVSLEEAITQLAEFLSLHLGTGEGWTRSLDPDKAPLLLTLTEQLLAVVAWLQRPGEKRPPRFQHGLQHQLCGSQQTEGPAPATTPTSSSGGQPLAPDGLRGAMRGDPKGQSQQREEEHRDWQWLEGTTLGQIEELKQQLEHQEEELGRLRLGVGITDSEKRIQHLTLENEALKQSLSLTRELLLQWGTGPLVQTPSPAQEEAEVLMELRSRLRETEETTETLRAQLGVQEGQLWGLQGALQELQLEAATRESEQRSKRELRQILRQLAGLRGHIVALRQGCGDLRGLVITFTQNYQGALKEAQVQVCWALGELSASQWGKRVPEIRKKPRRAYQGRLLELRGNIRVLCRLKPGSPGNLLNVNPGPGGTVTANYRGRQRHFRLDRVFPPDATQEEVFRELEPAVLSCLQGYSVCIFTYGQTGTGKTYSMEGPPEDPGIAPRALQSLFREMGTQGGPRQHRVTVSMIEIYNEAVRDLLAPGPPERLTVRQGPEGCGGIHVPGLTCWDVSDLRALHKMLNLGRRNRATAATHMNEHSSRSHALVTLTLTTAAPPHGPGTAGTLHLVDLAGSERVWKAMTTEPSGRLGARGQRLREAQTINRSLLALGGVMAALRARQPHVPFRDSQLTRLLQPALGPGATAVMLVQISSRPEDVGETVCSLKFAERVSQVELGPARRHRTPSSGTPSSPSTGGTPSTPSSEGISPQAEQPSPSGEPHQVS
ncbi:kinesin-like protein KIFC2 [Gracilinanus agilis]|uniref:kinesin-like protein KIFC2 n=1 Tax=Gracilinanus agilis TaxID=191870 RepID=UPI001CFCC718|nr:kinesin-like protein KIFC2 [Gracilinanus agilis]